MNTKIFIILFICYIYSYQILDFPITKHSYRTIKINPGVYSCVDFSCDFRKHDVKYMKNEPTNGTVVILGDNHLIGNNVEFNNIIFARNIISDYNNSIIFIQATEGFVKIKNCTFAQVKSEITEEISLKLCEGGFCIKTYKPYQGVDVIIEDNNFFSEVSDILISDKIPRQYELIIVKNRFYKKTTNIFQE